MARESDRGSQWNRWDPHIHAPGTILNDQFKGTEPWDDFLTRIERASPTIRALGITDYLSTGTYEAVRRKKAEGRLVDVHLIFPNVEIRFSTETAKGSPINAHLLCSPEDSDHLAQIHRFLQGLEFKYRDETYRCSEADLRRLGRAFVRSDINDSKALELGVTQFKVHPSQLKDAWNGSAWAQENILIAIAGGSQDGTAGLKDDSSFTATRTEIERMARIVFSGQPQQRAFWLGQGAASVDDLNKKWNGRKPCLHGSDAHHPEKVANPDLERMCWIKGDVTFESLRQVCIEPEERVAIQGKPPRGAMASQAIDALTTTNTAWLKNKRIRLNSGLVAVIGARGSGKTALADLLAAGGHTLSGHLNDRSFVRRAEQYLEDASVEVEWEDGGTTSASLAHVEDEEIFEEPRVQYLSQQFVDRLCSAEGLDDSLLQEMQRVVFQSHAPEGRFGTTSFRDLLAKATAPAKRKREYERTSLDRIANELTEQRELRASLLKLERAAQELSSAIAKDKGERTKLEAAGKNEYLAELERIGDAVDQARHRVDAAVNRHHTLTQLADAVGQYRRDRKTRLHELMDEFEQAKLNAEDWPSFETDFVGNIDAILKRETEAAHSQARALSGPRPGEPTVAADELRKASLLTPGANLHDQTLSLLQAELTRLRNLAGFSKENARKLAQLSQKIATDEAKLSSLERQIIRAKSAEARIDELLKARSAAYAGICEAIEAEEQALIELYQPLRERMQDDEGILRKLEFSVGRNVDAEAWAEEGELLLDLRKAGPFRGRGSLLDAAKETLLPVWENGTSADIALAMSNFRNKHEQALVTHSLVERSDGEAYRAWASQIAKWLYGTSHIKVSYGIKFDGVGIEQLSPGTRGIVLLLLYLALDKDDDRPLLIDQPEENLDPKSVFDELVTRFRSARKRRQIIIVTHNANLVVNTDADQVIVADCGPHREGQLPEITYTCGGLENPAIRRKVCEILEGGEAAFKERAKRLRVTI